MHPMIDLMEKEELKKLLDANIIQPINYLDWILNMVLIKKPIGKICISIDFRYLNKTYPKDDFPLLNIDNLVDAIARYEMLSLMDGFSSYNQIKIAYEDQHKIIFITP